jgi:hypothetical protein
MIDQTKTGTCATAPVRSVSLGLRALVGGSLLVLASALGTGAQAQSLGPLVQITQGDPFSTCTADNVRSQEAAYDSILYPGTSIEPWVAVDPTNSARLLVVHQQDRWNNGGARGLAGNVSTDGGSHWSDTIPTDVSRCTGGDFSRASDPWVAFSPLGTAFFFSLVLDPAQPTSPFGARHSGMLVSRSSDHGQTWGPPTTLIRDNTPHVLNDKNSISADPIAAGRVYAVWDRLHVFPLPGDTDADKLLAINDGVEIARELVDGLRTAAAGGAPLFKFAFTGPTFLSMTADDGDSWSTAVPIYQPGTNAQTINNLVVVLPTGDVLDFFTNIGNTGALNIGYIRSTDQGSHWSGPTFASDIHVVGVVTPDSHQRVRDAAILYSVAVDPASGALYLAWQDDRFSGNTTCVTSTGSRPIDGIVFSQSLDGGVTWSTPVQINKTPANANPCRQQAFIPAVVAAGDGTVVVTYYDFRNDTDAGGFEAADYFALFCHPSMPAPCSNAANWGNEKRLTSASFNILDAPVAGGHFLGDYMGLAASGLKNVVPVFGIATGPNVTATFTRRITLP